MHWYAPSWPCLTDMCSSVAAKTRAPPQGTLRTGKASDSLLSSVATTWLPRWIKSVQRTDRLRHCGWWFSD
jgi:hypothetical protein